MEFFDFRPFFNPQNPSGKSPARLQSLWWYPSHERRRVSALIFSLLPLPAALEAPWYKHSLTNQTVNVTESLRMECDVEGRPLPRLSWFKDRQPLHQISGGCTHLHGWCTCLHNSAATHLLTRQRTHTCTHMHTLIHQHTGRQIFHWDYSVQVNCVTNWLHFS